MLYKEIVTKEMWELLQNLMKDEKLKDFSLVGGTAYYRCIKTTRFYFTRFKFRDDIVFKRICFS
jgi:hypothetical protein